MRRERERARETLTRSRHVSDGRFEHELEPMRERLASVKHGRPQEAPVKPGTVVHHQDGPVLGQDLVSGQHYPGAEEALQHRLRELTHFRVMFLVQT